MALGAKALRWVWVFLTGNSCTCMRRYIEDMSCSKKQDKWACCSILLVSVYQVVVWITVDTVCDSLPHLHIGKHINLALQVTEIQGSHRCVFGFSCTHNQCFGYIVSAEIKCTRCCHDLQSDIRSMMARDNVNTQTSNCKRSRLCHSMIAGDKISTHTALAWTSVAASGLHWFGDRVCNRSK